MSSMKQSLAARLGLQAEDLANWTPARPPAAYLDDSFEVASLGPHRALIAYAIDDWAPPEFWNQPDELGEFQDIRNLEHRDAFVREHEGRGEIVLLVEKEEHGLVRFSVRRADKYHDRYADLGVAFLVPPPSIQEELRRGEKTYQDACTWANEILDSYSAYCNGQNYLLIRETVEWGPDGVDFHSVEHVSCGRMTGFEKVEAQLKQILNEDHEPQKKVAGRKLSPR